jgi:hypothetical protein
VKCFRLPEEDLAGVEGEAELENMLEPGGNCSFIVSFKVFLSAAVAVATTLG